MSKFRFYSISTASFLISSLVGFFAGRNIFSEFLVGNFGEPQGEMVLAYYGYTVIFSIVSSLAGLLIALIIIHRMGRRWGSQLSFGSHPVLKLTFLSFLTFLGLLVLLLFLIPTK